MKKLLIITGIIIASFQLRAQVPAASVFQGKPGMPAPAIGHIYGKLIDSDGKPVSNATVLLIGDKFDTATKKMKEVLIKGGVTESNGEFSYEELPTSSSIKVKISATGFRAVTQDVSFEKNANGGAPATSKDLGNITLTTDAKVLNTITITANTGQLKMDIDKKTFSVDKNIVSAGGTALDVMKNVPSVQVDIDGNVKLRNATPQIFIEGRPTTLSLDQIPADNIESVEVITNPSAKYDASGGNAGILNIVLKKNRKTGYNGNLRAGIDKRGGLNGGGDFSMRQGKVNVSASGMINQNKGRSTGTTDQLNLIETPNTSIQQENATRNNGGFAFGKLGLDYFITNRTTLSLNWIKVHGNFNSTDVINSNITAGSTIKFADRNATSNRTFNANGVQVGMKHIFPKAGEELTVDGNYFSGKSSGNALYVSDSLNNNHALYATERQQQISFGNVKFFTAQTDYVKPLKGSAKIEAGLRVSVQKLLNNNDTYNQNDSTSIFEKLASAGSNYSNTNNVYAAYTTFTNSIKNFGYQVGLRAESSSYTGELLNKAQAFSNSYPLSLFPSVFLSQKLNKDQQLQLNYSRRINRPNFFQLIPFTDRTDPLNITRGNPDLVPEFTNSLEASYSKNFKKGNNLLASVYYKSTNNLITRYQQREYDDVLAKEILINSYVNASSSYSIGSEITSVNNITKWWDVTTNINVYNSKINTGSSTSTQQGALWSWFGKVNNNFKLPSNFKIQLSANYQSKTNLPVNSGGRGPGGGPGFGETQSASQGYIKPFYAVDIAIQKSFLKNNALSATLSFSDIFRTRKQEQYSRSDYFIQDVSRLRDPQMIRLILAYKFGKIDMSLFKRKNMKAEGEGTQGAMQGMGN